MRSIRRAAPGRVRRVRVMAVDDSYSEPPHTRAAEGDRAWPLLGNPVRAHRALLMRFGMRLCIRVWIWAVPAGDTAASIDVREFPPRDSCSTWGCDWDDWQLG